MRALDSFIEAIRRRRARPGYLPKGQTRLFGGDEGAR